MCAWNLNYDTSLSMNMNRLTGIKEQSVVARGGVSGGEMKWEFGASRHKLLYIGWINKVLLYLTGNYI